MRSWLRHVKGCQLAELNWKPSFAWGKYGDNQSLMDQARAFFQNALDITLFSEDAKASQLIKQAEIDVLGVKLAFDGRLEAVYGVDIAYHENGLQYKDNVGGILKKLVRGRMAIQTYFGPVLCHMIFASPLVRPGPLQRLQSALVHVREFFSEYRLETTTTFYENETFRDEIVLPTLEASATTADSSELFLRSCRLLNGFHLVASGDFGDSEPDPHMLGNGYATGATPGRPRPRHPSRRASSPFDDEPVSPDKIVGWAKDPSLKVHRILALAVRHGPLPSERLIGEIRQRKFSRNSPGAVASLMTNAGNAYDLVFTEDAGLLRLHPRIEEVVRSQNWKCD
jgi:hypothetical protein